MFNVREQKTRSNKTKIPLQNNSTKKGKYRGQRDDFTLVSEG